jgi:polysaccharide export outer membrane protein
MHRSVKAPIEVWTLVVLALAAAVLAGCAASGVVLPAAGPTTQRLLPEVPVVSATASVPDALPPLRVIRVTQDVARRLATRPFAATFADAFASSPAPGLRIGPGDALEVSIWEAPPALLFGPAAAPTDVRAAPATSRASALPEQVVSSGGTISVPFVGPLQAAGRLPEEIEADLVARLAGKANRPQVMVRVVRNVSSNVTVVGEVVSSTRVALSPRGERLLDALAAAGGVRHPVGRISLQLTRGDQVRAMPLEAVISDPRQNVPLQPGDVLTALHQPLSLTVFGATGRNEELSFEAQGISLTQALARVGGLQDQRADPQGVFVFRFEDPALLESQGGPGRSTLPAEGSHASRTPDGRVPVVYQLDLRDPVSFFAAQSFPVQHRDVLYVSNASGAELQKFLNIVTAIAAPVLGVINVTR